MCGIFGALGHLEASNITYLGLYALQHRGQEAAGIVSTDGSRLLKKRRKTLVSEAFSPEAIRFLKGDRAIGHVRYSTSGANTQQNVQPFIAKGSFGEMSVAHNGNLTNFLELRREFEAEGDLFQSSSDTEVLLHLIARTQGQTIEDKIMKGLQRAQGAYSLLILTPNVSAAVRDPFGYRPLCLGYFEGARVVASETCAFDLIGADFEREIMPGEVVFFYPDGKEESRQLPFSEKKAFCVFEHIYFARPDSEVFGEDVYEIRKNLGRQLARENPVKADLVLPVPDSGVVTALGFSEESGIPFEMGLIRNHYIGRTFIEPKQSIRNFGVKIKLNPIRSRLSGKDVVVIDDSIVRGTTSRKIIKMIRDSGAKSVKMLISSPPVTGPCFYGIDTPTKSELIANNNTVEKIRISIGADYLGYLSLKGMYEAVKGDQNKYCDACFTGNYLNPPEC